MGRAKWVSYLLSDSDMLISYHNAQELLKKDSLLEGFIDNSNKKGLNYIVKTTHNWQIPSCGHNGSVAVYNFLSNISLALFNTSVGQESKDFRNQLYGYFENKENPSFNLVNGFGKELKE